MRNLLYIKDRLTRCYLLFFFAALNALLERNRDQCVSVVSVVIGDRAKTN